MRDRHIETEGALLERRHIEKSLYGLARVGWAGRRAAVSPAFLLCAADLPRPDGGANMEGIVGALYAHARQWAPGFEVPFYVPRVRFSSSLPAAGQYRVDREGYLFIDIGTQLASRRAAVLTILSHEACHHILDLSGIHGSTREETERLTDLATFVCGFGQLILAGHTQALRTRSGWARTHIGYLPTQHYVYAYQWVLRAQGLCDDLPVAEETEQRRGLLARLWRWYFGKSAPEPHGDHRATGAPLHPELLDLAGERRKVALTRLGGDTTRLARLLEHERRCNPGVDEVAALDAVIERLERDRR